MKFELSGRKRLTYIGLGAVILLIVAVVATPMIVGSYLSGESSRKRVEKTIATAIGGRCEIDSIDAAIGLLSSTITVDTLRARQDKSSFKAKQLKLEIDHLPLLGGELAVEKIILSAAALNAITPAGRAELRDINLYAELRGDRERLFLSGGSQADLRLVENRPGVSPNPSTPPGEIGNCSAKFNIKLSPRSGAIGLQDTEITTPLGTVLISGTADRQRQRIEYQINVKDSAPLRAIFPKALAEGYRLRGFTTKGELSMQPGKLPGNISATGSATLQQLNTATLPIKDISCSYKLDKGMLGIELSDATLLGGSINASISGDINRTSPLWRARANILDISIAEALKLQMPVVSGIDGTLSIAIDNLETRGWQYNPVLHHLSLTATPTISNGHIPKNFFLFIKSPLSAAIPPLAATDRDREIADLIAMTPESYDFNLSSGTITFKRGKASLANLSFESPTSFSTNFNGYVTTRNYAKLNVYLGGFEKLSGLDHHRGKHPISLIGTLPFPKTNFSGFFNYHD